MPKEKDGLSEHTRMVFESKEYAGKAGIVLFRGLFIEDKLRDNENGTIHLLLCLQEKVNVVLFRMNKMSEKTLWVDEKDERSDPLLNSLPKKPGSVRAWKAPMSE